MISLRNSTQMLLSTSFTMLNACSRPECIRKHPKLPNKLKIQNTPTRFSSSKPISSMNLRRWHTLNLSLHKCHLTQQRQSLHRAVSCTRKRNTKKPRQNSKKHSTVQDTNVTSLTISLSATTNLSSWHLLSNILLISLRRE